MTTSTIFFANQNCIDFGFLRADGCPIGYSVNPSFTLTGRIEEKEQVVIDFSDAKKKLKQFMDDSFDHRLVVFKNADGSLLGVESTETNAENRTVFHLKNALGRIELPEDAFCIVDIVGESPDVDSFVQNNLQIFLKDYCEKALLAHYGFAVEVQVKMATLMMSYGDLNNTVFPTLKFNYVHGLKNSTSYGCKNIGHGHLSYLHFEHDIKLPDQHSPDNKLVIEAFKEYSHLEKVLTNCIFVKRENLDHQQNGDEEFMVISYSTEERGFMEMTLNVNELEHYPDVNIHICDKETTIENLAERISEIIARECPNLSGFVNQLFVSEGLTKGCVYDRSAHQVKFGQKAA
ncbi:hypothetical protein [Ewingella americana]|uniref:6-carboxy-5,6,7,8-tetrahydropterin synthase n=1 Tax=Ewingella americana TaxID=41202 RepID=A0A502GGR2_9GAMM|nr:hypothetical protein [Ewingella americana]TPG60146.1 hypothetical protein EAH77_16385 [Ewingella americana]